ncbi:3-hydroxyacyl-CoA dehydrogenase NAD-binding domain-containing protein [Kitasatospora griseola]|uniref:3-hydroxyacyl-CoA dehydrogenase family protein n=2 Tax=Kitasatospora griseola TaxID=2064 RepID=UPI0038559ECF
MTPGRKAAGTALAEQCDAVAEALVLGHLNRAVALHDEGAASRADLDTAMRLGCGLPEGPFGAIDRLGPDRVHRRLVALLARTGDPAFAPAAGLLAARPDAGPASAADPVGAAAPARLGVLGSGTMAGGIAEAAARAGVPVVLVARAPESAQRARTGVDGSLDRAVRRGRATRQDAADALARIRFGADPAPLADCDLVVEAVAEDERVKREVFARLGALCAPGAVLATSTSSLSVARCTEPAGRPERLVGLHFFNPAPVMRLVELVRGPATGGPALAAARALCGRLGKTVVESPDRTGFLVNYLLFAYLARAVRAVERGDADPAGTDAAVESGFGFPLGPFALLDTIGLDVSLAILEQLHEAYREPDFEPPRLLREAVAQGLLGRKNGRGFRTG